MRSESLFVLLDCAHQCEILLLGIVVVQPIGMHLKVHLLAIWLVHSKHAVVILAIICDFKFLPYFLEQENISYGMIIEPHITVILDVCLLVSGEGSAIAMDSHAVIDSPD